MESDAQLRNFHPVKAMGHGRRWMAGGIPGDFMGSFHDVSWSCDMMCILIYCR